MHGLPMGPIRPPRGAAVAALDCPWVSQQGLQESRSVAPVLGCLQLVSLETQPLFSGLKGLRSPSAPAERAK